MKHTILMLTLLLLAPLHAADQQAPPTRPNIVVILADDMHWQLPGFNGGRAATPHLDRLAREGTRLTQFYVHAVCSPTRAAFLTGRYPFRTGTEERSHGNDTAGMLPDERTLAEALRSAGYDTALIGKWHLGNWYQRQLPLQRGFEGIGNLISHSPEHYYQEWVSQGGAGGRGRLAALSLLHAASRLRGHLGVGFPGQAAC